MHNIHIDSFQSAPDVTRKTRYEDLRMKRWRNYERNT